MSKMAFKYGAAFIHYAGHKLRLSFKLKRGKPKSYLEFNSGGCFASPDEEEILKPFEIQFFV